MKQQTVGAGVFLAVAVAAVRFAAVPNTALPLAAPAATAQAGTPQSHGANPARARKDTADYEGGCVAFAPRPSEIAAEALDPGRGAAKDLLDRFFALDPRKPTAEAMQKKGLGNVRYAIAMAPDPRHTNLAIRFDREMALVQQAAQDDGYTYDSSWLPWETATASFPLLLDQGRSRVQTDHREACPGVLLFRKGVKQPKLAPTSGQMPKPEPADPYSAGLVVFVVVALPTGGLNQDQWDNAIRWLSVNPPLPAGTATTASAAPHSPPPALPALSILGPILSGSLPSIQRALADLYRVAPGAGHTKAFAIRFPRINLLSGNVASCSSILWFQRALAADEELKHRVLFGTFAENDEVMLFRFLNYTSGQGTARNEVTILSEDETAYANDTPSVPSPNSVPSYPSSGTVKDSPEDRPVRLSYPRDISAVRAAYDKQAIFKARTSSDHPILQEQPDLEGGNDEVTDTIPAYSGALSAIDEEAELYGVVSDLRAHHTRFLVLRGSNPLDLLFLTRFFHRAYPEARIVMTTADLLFRREIDTTEFRGVFSLTNFPLVPRNQHWTHLSEREIPAGQPHAHRTFQSGDNEGIYNAARFLLADPTEYSLPDPGVFPPRLPFMPGIQEFADPFWMHEPDELLDQTHAPVWLSVLGRDGYWPIAVLNDRSKWAQASPEHPLPLPPPTTISTMGSAKAHYDLKPGSGAPKRFNDSLLFSLPFGWCLTFALALALLAYQAFAVASYGRWTAAGLLAPFRECGHARSQAVLVGLNSAFAAAIPLSLLSVGGVLPRLGYLLAESWFVFWLTTTVIATVWLFAALLLRPSRLPGMSQKSGLQLRSDGTIGAFVFLGSLAAMALCGWVMVKQSSNPENSMALFLRMTHLTSGVSPLVPVLLIFAGCYLWTWQALAGNTLSGPGRPRLPAYENMCVDGFWARLWNEMRGRPLNTCKASEHTLGTAHFRISEAMGRRILAIANPLSLDPRVTVVPLAVGVVAIGFFWKQKLPLLGLESRQYAVLINLALLFTFLLSTAEALRLYSTWIELRRLLLALNRLPLRRTFARLRAIGQSSLWSMSGAVQRMQMQFFSQQIDAAHRLVPRPGIEGIVLHHALAYGYRFAESVAPRVSAGARWDLEVLPTEDWTPRDIRSVLAETTADLLNFCLLPDWTKEPPSLNLTCKKALHSGDNEDRAALDLPLSNDPTVRAAEEFVCLQYIAFIQNVLARMRTMVLSMGFLFVAVCFAIAFYPFVPRTQIVLGMAANLLLIAVAVTYVYAGMERDTTLSYITNTSPGRLGAEFYVKTAAFLAGPVLGLLTTQFPAISEFVLGTLQPGLDAMR